MQVNSYLSQNQHKKVIFYLMVKTFSCRICVKTTGGKEDPIYCQINNLNYKEYTRVSGNNEP